MAFAQILNLFPIKEGGCTRDVFDCVQQVSEVSVQFLYSYETGTLDLSNINGHENDTATYLQRVYSLSLVTRREWNQQNKCLMQAAVGQHFQALHVSQTLLL